MLCIYGLSIDAYHNCRQRHLAGSANPRGTQVTVQAARDEESEYQLDFQ